MQLAGGLIKEIEDYIKAGAPFEEGVRLFLQIKGNKHPFSRILKRKSPATHKALVTELCRLANLQNPEFGISPAVSRKKTLREDFPFLNKPDCPPELKILAADKMTAYKNYVAGHKELFGCNNTQEQFETVKKVVENYIENRTIIREFEYYKKHNDLLGMHPIFKAYQKIQDLRKMGVYELVKKRKQLQDNIWRIESEMKKNKQPHLKVEREQRLQQKQNELAEVERILKSYG